MDDVGFGRFRARAKGLSAALGGGVLITMGALTLTYQSSSVGANSGLASRDTRITVTSPSMVPSFAPTQTASICDNASPHAWAGECG